MVKFLKKILKKILQKIDSKYEEKEKEREKKSREGQGLCPVPSAFERRKRVRSVLVGMMEMMLFGWEQNNQE